MYKETEMQSKKQIFYLMSCDGQDMRASERLVTITNSATKLKRIICEEIMLGNMEYYFEYDGTEKTRKKMVQKLRSDWQTETRNTINSRLSYGRYDYVYDGEVL